jgi:hypothetical protein
MTALVIRAKILETANARCAHFCEWFFAGHLSSALRLQRQQIKYEHALIMAILPSWDT